MGRSRLLALAYVGFSFGTYMGKTGTTRAGAYGSINTTKLQDSDYGFGVFAYSTGKTAYSAYRTQDDVSGRFPNFMYNEKVTYNSAAGKDYNRWSYSNTKYWPNEIGDSEPATADDDQNNDSANDPAKGSNENGGKVSFFAYAPYATTTVTQKPNIDGQTVTDHDGTTSGIVAISGNGFNGGTSDASNTDEKYKFSDPYIKYVISNDHEKQVDLLWGTIGDATSETSSENVVNETPQAGVAANTYKEQNSSGTDYATEKRPTFNVNADLTKQKTTGTVNFRFKHALAKIGGSYIGGGNGSDDNPSTVTNGLMIVLDIDKDGAETGGSLNPYTGGTVTENTKYNTKVTVNQITIQSEKQLTDVGLKAIQTNNSTFDYMSTTYTAQLINTGYLNLVTGVWSDLTQTGSSSTRTQTIDASVDGTTDQSKDAILATEIAEPNNFTAAGRTNLNKDGFESLPIGVTTVPKNVYKSEAQPFVFIPGTYPILTFTITYTVRTYDPNLYNSYTEVKQKVTKRLYILEEIKLNKQYNILMHLGLTGVKFTATVSEWDLADSDESGSTDGVGSSTIINTTSDGADHVYLPINVAELESATPSTAIDSYTWDDVTTRNTSVTLNYSDGTHRASNATVGGTGDNKDELVMPTLTATSSNADCTVEKHLDGGKWDGTFDVTWTKNLTTSIRHSVITFTYGNQTTTLTSTQGVGPLKITLASPYDATGVTSGTITVQAANGETGCEVPTSWNYSGADAWITNLTSAVVLADNEASTSRSNTGVITITKNDATGTIAAGELSQNGYTIAPISATNSSGTVTVSGINNDSGTAIASGAYTIKIEDSANNDVTSSYTVTNSDGSATITGMTTGTYTITVTHTASGATKSESITIS